MQNIGYEYTGARGSSSPNFGGVVHVTTPLRDSYYYTPVIVIRLDGVRIVSASKPAETK
jgi:hypothetical protein